MIEVERKAYLKDLSILDKIKKISEYTEKSTKKDTYFAPFAIKRLDVYKDPIFRIRSKDGKNILSYKKKKIVEKTEINIENEIDISSLDKPSLRSFFQYIGFYPFIEKKKTTNLYKTKKNNFDVSIEHNNIENLGEFIEIEILIDEEKDIEKANKAINDLFEKLEIQKEDIESKYYIDLLMEKNRWTWF